MWFFYPKIWEVFKLKSSWDLRQVIRIDKDESKIYFWYVWTNNQTSREYKSDYESTYSKVNFNKITINWLDINYIWDEHNINFIVQINEMNYSFQQKYIWTVEEYVVTNKNLIYSHFQSLIEKDINRIISNITWEINSFIRDISKFSSPSINPFIMAAIMEMFKNSSIKVTEAFNDEDTKKSLLTLFKR